MIQIKEISARDKKLYKEFIDFPNKLYADCPYYIPYTFGDEVKLLNFSKSHPGEHYKGKLFLAFKNGVIVGRIGALINYIYNEKVNKKYMRMTRFDFINDLEVVKALLDSVEKFAKEEGMNIVHGPFGFNDIDREGLLINKGFDIEATLATNYNYSYYKELIEKCGYVQENLWLEHLVTLPEEIPDKLIRVSNLATDVKKLRLVQEKNVPTLIKKYVNKILDLYDNSYAILPGAIPLSPEVRKNIIQQFRIMLSKRYISLVVTENDEVIAFAFGMATIGEQLRKCHGKPGLLTLLSIRKEVKKPRKIEMCLVGVQAEWRNSGALALIMKQLLVNLKEDGIKQIETNPELVTNVNVRSLWKDYDYTIIKERATFQKVL